ncbi:glutathione S-transferase family protein [Emcibacter sp. SYSU 3D8]|uniref:glutathione S-transferase family protein n=1 Tax=Emcibacter sp. SYSU 3D8 TaxID=3133969 RepID=UPI0031FF1B79
MKLYEFAPTRSIRVRWTLQELGVPFEAVVVNMMKGEHRAPAYLKINRAGKLPALVDGDLVLTESMAIITYLAEKYPEKELIPADIRARAEFHKWIMFTATELEQPLWRISRNTSLYRKDKRQPSDVTRAAEDFKPMAQVLDEHMIGREFVVGDRATVADFALAYTLDWANEAGLLGEFPGLVHYMERMYQRPHAGTRIGEALASLRN